MRSRILSTVMNLKYGSIFEVVVKCAFRAFRGSVEGVWRGEMGERGERGERERVWVSTELSLTVSHCPKPITSLISCMHAVQLIPLYSLVHEEDTCKPLIIISSISF